MAEDSVKGRRTISGSHPSVTYQADENAQLVPDIKRGASVPPVENERSKPASSLSVAKKPSTSNFSLQMEAARHRIGPFEQPFAAILESRVSKASIKAEEHGKRIDAVKPDPLKTAKSILENRKDKKLELVISSGGLSSISTTPIANIRTRPSPLQLKRSLSNITSASKPDRSFLNKLSIHASSTKSSPEAQIDKDDATKIRHIPDKAARVLGATASSSSAKAPVPKTSHGKVSPSNNTSSGPKPPLHSASGLSTHSVSKSRSSGSTFGSRIGRHRDKHATTSTSTSAYSSIPSASSQGLRYYDDDAPPTPPSKTRPAVPPKDHDSKRGLLKAGAQESGSPTRVGNAGYRPRAEIVAAAEADVRSVYGTVGNADAGNGQDQGRHKISNHLAPPDQTKVSLNYSPSIYQDPPSPSPNLQDASPSLVPCPLQVSPDHTIASHQPESRHGTPPEGVRNTSNSSSLSLPFIVDTRTPQPPHPRIFGPSALSASSSLGSRPYEEIAAATADELEGMLQNLSRLIQYANNRVTEAEARAAAAEARAANHIAETEAHAAAVEKHCRDRIAAAEASASKAEATARRYLKDGSSGQDTQHLHPNADGLSSHNMHSSGFLTPPGMLVSHPTSTSHHSEATSTTSAHATQLPTRYQPAPPPTFYAGHPMPFRMSSESSYANATRSSTPTRTSSRYQRVSPTRRARSDDVALPSSHPQGLEIAGLEDGETEAYQLVSVERYDVGYVNVNGSAAHGRDYWAMLGQRREDQGQRETGNGLGLQVVMSRGQRREASDLGVHPAYR